jgi:ABC-2 type transport system ATP-binding protein
MELVREAHAGGTTVFFSSHILSEVEKICQTVAFIRDGRLLRVGPVHEVLGVRSHYVEAECEALPNASVLENVAGVSQVSVDSRTVTFRVEGDMSQALAVLSPFHVKELVSREPSLTDVFLGLYEERGGQDA